jgi:hypothetical protein
MVDRPAFIKPPHSERVKIVQRFMDGNPQLLKRLKTDVDNPENQTELEILREVYIRKVLQILLDGYCNDEEAKRAIREVFETIDEFNEALKAVLGTNP